MAKLDFRKFQINLQIKLAIYENPLVSSSLSIYNK